MTFHNHVSLVLPLYYLYSLLSLEYTELITLAAVITALLLLALGGLAVLGRAAQLTVLSAALLLATLTVRCCLHPRQEQLCGGRV